MGCGIIGTVRARCSIVRRVIRRTIVALALTLAVGAPSGAAVPSVPTLDPDALHPGQKAVVRTVFAGDRIESFEAEILGVLRGGRVEGDMIVARATSERVIQSGVAQGMSGSPVYVDGKLVGALSSGWTFEREPIFGITPIGEMLRVLDLPSGGDDPSGAGPTGVENTSLPRFREFAWPEDDSPAPQASAPPVRAVETNPFAGRASFGALAPLALPLACTGLSPEMLERARDLLAPLGLAVVPGGQAPAGGAPPAELEPGSPVAVDLMRGDLQMSAIGTVTYRDHDRVLIFGHPFFQAGAVRMPLATAEILTIVPSAAASFKLGVRGREVGVATQDRRAAMAGTLGGKAHLLPLDVRVLSARQPEQHFHFDVLEDRAMAPTLIAIASLNSVMESGGAGAGQTIHWSMRVVRQGAPPLELHDVATGESAFGELLGGMVSPLRFLFNNPYRKLALESLSVEVHVEPVREQWTLRSARLVGNAVRPGASATLQCELERWRGGRSIRTLHVTVPEEAPPGRYLLWVGGGSELNRFESIRRPARYRPTSLDDAWRRLAVSRPNDALYAALFARAPEITNEGRDYPELPSSAVIVLSGGSATNERRRSDTATMDETREALEGVVHGELLLELVVDEHAP